jgi:hypothetical protein
MPPRPGESLSVDDVQALESAPVVEAAEDIDIDEWLTGQAAASKATDVVVIEGKRIRIAAISEGEENKLIKQSRKLDPRDPRGPGKVDMLAYRRAYVAFSLAKASGKPVFPEQMEAVPPGNLTRLQNAIQTLSKYEAPERPDPFASLI